MNKKEIIEQNRWRIDWIGINRIEYELIGMNKIEWDWQRIGI